MVLADEPGALARLGEVTVAAGVHLRGLAAFTGDGRGFVHALVDDDDVDDGQAGAQARQDEAWPTRARCSSPTSAPAGSST